MSTSERLARSLLLYAARSAPPALSERLAEEWLADLEARRGGWARLRHALGCCWATSIIAREHGAVAVAAAAPAGAGTLTHLGSPDSLFVSRRALALGLIACLHVGIILAFANGLLQRVIPTAQLKPIVATFEDPAPHSPPPLPPDPTLRTPTIYVPPLIVESWPPQPPDPGRIAASVTQPPAPPPSRGPAQAVKRVMGGPGLGFPNTEDYYPAGAIRAGEHGGATVSVCVDPAGRLTGAPAIERSSGSARLDAGALKLARAGSGHYQPTTEDGRPVNSCYSFRIRFTLHE